MQIGNLGSTFRMQFSVPPCLRGEKDFYSTSFFAL